MKHGPACLTQRGPAAGVENVAAKAAASATASADAVSHGASAVTDGDPSSFWASPIGEAGPVDLLLDLGGEHLLERVKISWEFPAKAFAILASTDGSHWAEVYATSINAVNVTSVALGRVLASKIKISMRETHPLYGSFLGRPIFGIKAVSVLAPRLVAALEDCAEAAASRDARDKYFTVALSEHDAAPSAALRSELPALEAAKASLGASIGELAAAAPKLHGCRKSLASAWNATGELDQWQALVQAKAASRSSQTGYASEKALASAAAAVSVKTGLDLDGAKALLAAARSVILSVRGALR